VVLFPHLIAGPIVRHWEIMPQFVDREMKANRNNFGVEITLFLFGLFNISPIWRLLCGQCL
jgi:alginate O-acetyltransferase complex protein AlgI